MAFYRCTVYAVFYAGFSCYRRFELHIKCVYESNSVCSNSRNIVLYNGGIFNYISIFLKYWFLVVIISLPVYGVHFRMSKSLFATLNCFIGHSAFYLLGFLSCLGENNNLISNMFWYSLFDALNLIT